MHSSSELLGLEQQLIRVRTLSQLARHQRMQHASSPKISRTPSSIVPNANQWSLTPQSLNEIPEEQNGNATKGIGTRHDLVRDQGGRGLAGLPVCHLRLDRLHEPLPPQRPLHVLLPLRILGEEEGAEEAGEEEEGAGEEHHGEPQSRPHQPAAAPATAPDGSAALHGSPMPLRRVAKRVCVSTCWLGGGKREKMGKRQSRNGQAKRQKMRKGERVGAAAVREKGSEVTSGEARCRCR